MPTLEDLAERIERLVLRHEELQRTNTLLVQQLANVSGERDHLKSRLAAARTRIDALLERLPADNAGGRMKQLEVTIMGQSYILGCPEGGEAALLEAVGSVDTEMSAIRDAGKVKARERIAVLAALNLAYRLAERPEPSPAASASAGGSSAQPVDDARIAALIGRIDGALGSDGRLL